MTDPIAAAPATGTPPSTEAVAAPDSTTAPAAAPATVAAATPTTAEAPQSAAPEKYDFAAAADKMPPNVLAKFEGIAKELGLSQSAALKVLNELGPEMESAVKTGNNEMVSQWIGAAKADKEFGGEKLNENLAIAKKALEAFGSPELTDMLNKTGLGNHPELIRVFFRAGQKITSGSFVPSGQGQGGKASTASKLYPSMNQA